MFITTANQLGDDPCSAARPDGDHPPGRLHRAREGEDRAGAPGEAPASAHGLPRRRRSFSREEALRKIARLHAGSGRAQPGAPDRAASAARWPPGSPGVASPPRSSSAPIRSASTLAGTSSKRGQGANLRSPASPPGSPSPPGGEILFVEATHEGHQGDLTLTGQLGDVMKELAQIALSYVRSKAAELGIDPAATGQADCTSTCPQARPPRTARRRAWP